MGAGRPFIMFADDFKTFASVDSGLNEGLAVEIRTVQILDIF